MGMIRHAVYEREADVPRRPAYAIGETVWYRGGQRSTGKVHSSQVEARTAGPGAPIEWMWVYAIFPLNARVPALDEGIPEEHVRPAAEAGGG